MSKQEKIGVNPSREPLTLIVGDAAAWLSAGRSLPDDKGLHYTSYEDLSKDLLDDINPDIVLAPLLGQGFDAMDLAIQLDIFGYKGRFRALSPDLPNPKLILKEVKSLCPKIDFDLFIVDDSADRRMN
ncbi:MULTISPECIES: hypothetical protein [Halocynthiibacter]|uniref:Uncharacterized protein n=1 Tax=Halocynthiibacter halioticoli TaxID=2986804 RepID=A0AAE3IYC4_9RHOB|nr:MULTISPECIES: hypothetical protein [Halocynthiibacter]MCV6824358.1 hypothetical protein [Halocynthiibacter halioticoli]MCW4057359.1 hypothetical protein [Halocynthiibacter sp. SDUM655004]MDE0589603.1 hypothetical protein [Halocynthiibacter sp. C4]